MASERKPYHYIPAKSWWALRKQFNTSIPKPVTLAYLVAVLSITEGSAKDLLRGLQAVGLVDEDDPTMERATLWRDDNSYSEVCRQIRGELYPPELLEAIPGPEIDKQAARRWFMTDTGCGEKAAIKMTAMYALLVKADPSVGDENNASKSKQTKSQEAKIQPIPSDEPQQPEPANQQQDPPHVPVLGLEMPEVRLNLEIRIDAGVTPEQIDLIFESMAKHLYRRDDERQ